MRDQGWGPSAIAWAGRGEGGAVDEVGGGAVGERVTGGGAGRPGARRLGEVDVLVGSADVALLASGQQGELAALAVALLLEVEEAVEDVDEGTEGPVLVGYRGAAVGGEVVDEGGELRGAEGARVATFVEAAEGGAGGLDEGHGPVLGREGRGDGLARSTAFYRRGARASCGGAVDLAGDTRVALAGRSAGAEISRICRGYDAGAARAPLIARRFWGEAGDGRRLYPGNMRIRCRFLIPDLQELRRHREPPHMIAMLARVS